MSKVIKLILAIVLVLIIALSFGAGFTVGLSHLPESAEGLNKVAQVWHIIRSEHVDRGIITADNLSRAAIEGMLDSLNDPYASYLEAEQYELGQSNLEGAFSGIGAYVSVEDGQLKIIAPIAGSPAEAAGILAGDTILEINGEPVGDMSMAEAIIKIRGPRGTNVTLLVQHDGEAEPATIEITRAEVEVPSITLEMEDDIAHISISEFTERTGRELTPLIEELTANGASGIILDLRGNPGGLLDTVIEVTSHFLAEGIILKTQDYNGKLDIIEVEHGFPVTDLPMVALVNGGSASGSEVLAGALQYHGRATIAGTTTFGKGSVNILRRLDDGSGIYITTARWLTPGGQLIEGEGIEPDIELEVTGDEALNWAVDYLETIITEG